jgi:hypothetical protein
MKAVESQYYPPRAGRFGRSLGGWFRLRRAVHRPRIAPPRPAPSWPRLALWLLVPGSFALARGRRLRGAVVLSIWLSMIAAYWIWIGTARSSWALVLASAIHSVTAAITFAACLEHRTPGSRLRRAAMYGFLLVLLLYIAGPHGLTRRVVLVVNGENATYLINTAVSNSELRRGDWIAYQYYSHSGATGFDRILGLPGETIRFHEDAFEVDGTAYQRVSDRMPTAGEKHVGEREYFVWPAGARLSGYAGNEAGTRLLQGVATVPEERVLGRAWHRWLWRKQTLDPLVVLKDWTPPPLSP